MHILAATASVLLCVVSGPKENEAGVGSTMTMETAQTFHLELQELLPNNLRLRIGGFPEKKWIRGLEPHDRTKTALGTWRVLDVTDTTTSEGKTVLEVCILQEPQGADAQWNGYGIKFETFDFENLVGIKLRQRLISALNKRPSGDHPKP